MGMALGQLLTILSRSSFLDLLNMIIAPDLFAIVKLWHFYFDKMYVTVSTIMAICFSGLDKAHCLPADLERAKSLVPKALESYVMGMYKSVFLYVYIICVVY